MSAAIRRDEQFVYKAAKRLVEELSWLLNKKEEEEEEVGTFEPCGLKLMMGPRCPGAVGSSVKLNPEHTAQRSHRASS